jgi:hypothetical protein
VKYSAGPLPDGCDPVRVMPIIPFLPFGLVAAVPELAGLAAAIAAIAAEAASICRRVIINVLDRLVELHDENLKLSPTVTRRYNRHGPISRADKCSVEIWTSFGLLSR